MGCISSKPAVVDGGDREAAVVDHIANAGNSPHHVVSLTSTTYGALKLEVPMEEAAEEKIKRPSPLIIPFRKSISSKEEEQQPLEVINAWELMSDLEEDDSAKLASAVPPPIYTTPSRKKLPPADSGCSKPSAPPFSTPRRRLVGKEKENNSPRATRSVGASPFNWTRVTNPLSPIENNNKLTKPAGVRYKSTPSPKGLRLQASTEGRPSSVASRRRSLTPFFDPELVASLEKELLEEKEKIKKVISLTPRSRRRRSSSSSAEALLQLESYEPLCPRGGADSVVLYTTTLRGIRKTFDECNAARAAIKACGVRFLERDVSMDFGYREELRTLLGGPKSSKDVGIPLPVLFVKGRLIGGAAEILNLDDEGRLDSLLSGIPRASTAPCEGCGGVRFVLCMECSGSCKVRRDDEKEGKVVVVKCGECNENGLIHCPICRCCC